MSQERLFLEKRKRESSNKDNKGVVTNNPDKPHVEVKPLDKLAVVVPASAKVITAEVPFEIRPINHNDEEVNVKGFIAAPLSKVPLTPDFYTSYGGGRVGGGGISRESLRRAKRKAKRKE